MKRAVAAIVSALAMTLGAATVAAACTVSKFAELPLTMVGMAPMVDARINGRPVRFLADSGAFFSIISPGTAAEHKLPLQPAPAGFVLRAIGGSVDTSVTHVRDFSIAGQSIPNVTFLVGGSESGGAGLIGQNVLGLRDAEYDLANSVIRLLDSKGCGNTNLAYWASGKPVSEVPIGPIDRGNAHITGTIVVNGVKLRAIFDTGASASGLTVAAAARAGVHLSDPGVTFAGFIHGGGRGTVRSWTAPFASFAVGDEVVKNTRLRIADIPNTDWDMLVGADFFLSHRLYVANSRHRMYLTYNGGPVFVSLPASKGASAPPPAGAEPAAATDGAVDADALGRQASVLAARHDYAGALALLDRAVGAAPQDGALRLQRARMHQALHQPLLAAADLDQAVTLRPDDAETRMVRATLRYRANEAAGARADADAAAAGLAPAADLHLALASLFVALEAPDRAIADLDLWIKAHPADARQPAALNSRCWARALAGRDLPKALADCNAALRARPGVAAFLDSRALVRLRLGDAAQAISDYDAALAITPRSPWALYGRGLARIAVGRTSEGQADLAAAGAIDPAVVAKARRYGIAAGAPS